ncbi:cell division control protein 6 homolog [Scaptodrosophila lebanonensis]|uniref:Cell division control protein 6 homolog n=1 Tax=Drosophila lebanonensis TaxID=7225 RepID=A0A6J2UFT1_DROLE|nr:cell division control protein 6 homolog [Scaptodrosophila lebanonensis]
MAAVRRSTRLSSVSKTEATQSPATTTTPRRSEIWRRRQMKNLSSDDEDDCIVVISENNENRNLLNKMDRSSSRRRSAAASAAATKAQLQLEHEILKTPRSSKKTSATSVSRTPTRTTTTTPSSKREMQQKHNSLQKMCTIKSSDDEEDDAKTHVSPPKQRKKQQLIQHLISPTRLLDRLSIDERKEEQSETKTEDNPHHKTLNKYTHSNTEAKDVPEVLASPICHNDQNIEETLSKADAKVKPQPQPSPTRHKQQNKEEAKTEAPVPSPTRNKYQNARRVLNSAETQNLPGRESQLQELREFFTTHLDTQTSGSLYVSGQPGTGKTACLSLLLRAPEFAQRLQRVYINCTSIASVGAVFKKLCAELNIKPAGRTERDHQEAIQKHLRTAKRMLLLVLDEIDQLCTSRQEVLYTIFEWPSLAGARILLVGIANSLDLTDRALMRLNARCELKPRLMHFPPYTKQQIVDIFKARLAEADVLDVFPPVTLQLLAAKVSAVSGDVRRALDIGRRVVEIAEQQKRVGEREFNMQALNFEGETKAKEDTLKPVQVTQVAAVLNKVYGASQNLDEDIEGAFPLQQKLMLCSLVLMLRNERNKDISIGRLHEVYRRVCAKRNILALDQAEFAGTVDLVETRGILRIMRKKEPRLSKVVLQWDEEEVHGALSDKQLIASILNDTACLGK